MQFYTLLRATTNGETIYFDGNGMLYEKHPVRSHYTPTGRYVYYEYYGKPLLMIEPCMACLGSTEYDYDIEYEISDINALKSKINKNRRRKQNGSK